MTEDDALHCQARLARNVTHALGNMLTVIGGNLDLTADDLEGGRPADGVLIQRAQAAARRAGELLVGLRAFYGTAAHPRDIDPVDWWASLERDLGHRAVNWSGPASGTRAHLDPDDWARAVHALAGLLDQDGTISGELSATGEDGLRMVLRLRGIRPEQDPECTIFEPFAFGEASAIGLSAAWGAARRAGGTIEADRDSEGGLTVSLHLPNPADTLARPR